MHHRSADIGQYWIEMADQYSDGSPRTDEPAPAIDASIIQHMSPAANSKKPPEAFTTIGM